MDLGVRGRVALICGSSAGLGFAVARALHAEGARVALNGRSRERLDRAVAALGPDSVGFVADVSRADECAGLVEAVHQSLGGPDILLCNSGGPPAAGFDQHPGEAWQQALDNSLLSTVHLCRAAVPYMRTRGWGRILCSTSFVARQPSPGLILSTTARAGVLGFAKALADEVATAGITVNVLCPGFFETDRLRDLARARGESQGKAPEQVLLEMGQAVPMRRVGTPAEFAAAAAFLASEPARYITGTVLSVDGGLTRAIV